jgi:hypothetical protein
MPTMSSLMSMMFSCLRLSRIRISLRVRCNKKLSTTKEQRNLIVFLFETEMDQHTFARLNTSQWVYISDVNQKTVSTVDGLNQSKNLIVNLWINITNTNTNKAVFKGMSWCVKGCSDEGVGYNEDGDGSDGGGGGSGSDSGGDGDAKT